MELNAETARIRNRSKSGHCGDWAEPSIPAEGDIYCTPGWSQSIGSGLALGSPNTFWQHGQEMKYFGIKPPVCGWMAHCTINPPMCLPLSGFNAWWAGKHLAEHVTAIIPSWHDDTGLPTNPCIIQYQNRRHPLWWRSHVSGPRHDQEV